MRYLILVLSLFVLAGANYKGALNSSKGALGYSDDAPVTCDTVTHFTLGSAATYIHVGGRLECETQPDSIYVHWTDDTLSTYDSVGLYAASSALGYTLQYIINGLTPSDTIYVRWRSNAWLSNWFVTHTADSIDTTLICIVPVIDSLSDDTITIGDNLTIYGLLDDSCVVTINGVPQTIVTRGTDSCVITVSGDAGNHNLIFADTCGADTISIVLVVDNSIVVTVDPVSDTTTGPVRMWESHTGDSVQIAWYRFDGEDTTLISRDSVLQFNATVAIHGDSIAAVIWNSEDTVMTAKAYVYFVYAAFDSLSTDSTKIYLSGNFLSGEGWSATLNDTALTHTDSSTTIQIFEHSKVVFLDRRNTLVLTDETYTLSLWIGRRKSTGNNKTNFGYSFKR